MGTVGRVVIGIVVQERLKTVGRVARAGCVAQERLKADCRVKGAGGETEQRISSLSGVVVGIPSVRCWGNRSTRRRKRKRSEHESNENKSAPQRRSAQWVTGYRQRWIQVEGIVHNGSSQPLYGICWTKFKKQMKIF